MVGLVGAEVGVVGFGVVGLVVVGGWTSDRGRSSGRLGVGVG